MTVKKMGTIKLLGFFVKKKTKNKTPSKTAVITKSCKILVIWKPDANKSPKKQNTVSLMFPGWIFLEINSQLFRLQVQSCQEKLKETEKAHSGLREQSVFPSAKTRILGYGKLVYL